MIEAELNDSGGRRGQERETGGSCGGAKDPWKNLCSV